MSWNELQERARQWLADDPDPETRAELEALLAQGPSREADLRERFCGPLEFGTAGLRGVLGAGESLMNRAVVIRTAAGLAEYLLAQDAPRALEGGVAIGYDGRRLSREFAEEVAAVLLAKGLPAHLSARECPTPLLAFAVLELGAAAGVMVTASHNPREYNGFKVYAQNGAQIVPPMDRDIATSIQSVPAAREIPRADLGEAREKGRLVEFAQDLDSSYLSRLLELTPGFGGDRDFAIAYTALHGVGAPLMIRALAQAGFERVFPVAEQNEPDGAFPTVVFPNPEEEGAMDLVLALARAKGAELVLAHDPDADRLAVAVRVDNEYVQLTGNEVGALLGHYLVTQGAQTNPRLVMTTVVSSPLLGRIAAGLGVGYEETLTGFKWIANRALEAKAQGIQFVFGYEEALGYTVGELVRDKDGISAALCACELTARLRAQGKTLLDGLEEICREYGLYVSGQVSLKYPGAEGSLRMKELMERLRKAPPKSVSELEVLSLRDYERQLRVERDGTTTPLSLPQSNVLAFDLEGGHRLIVRPSGTEPKVKLYVDVRHPIGAQESYPVARAQALELLAQLQESFARLLA